MQDWQRLVVFLKYPDPQERQTVLFVQKVHPVMGTEQIWHFPVEFKKYMDLHYRQAVLEEQIEHPSIADEHKRH